MVTCLAVMQDNTMHLSEFLCKLNAVAKFKIILLKRVILSEIVIEKHVYITAYKYP